jgi:ectoine hydroxylase-related dioxygenase (phytanoyl-CoA dioxygenase family)
MTDVQDLSLAHQPVGRLLDQTKRCSDDADFSLSDEQLQSFERDGFLVGPQVLEAAQIQQLRKELAELVKPGHPGQELWHEYHSNESADSARVLFHALGAWRISPGFHDLLWHPAFTTPASQLLNGPVRFWHDQLFCKPARHGGVVAWHQDYSYWTRTKPMAHLTCWIGLDDATIDNGCVHYVPGSHRWDLLPITGLAGDMQAIRSVLDADQQRQFDNPTAVELTAGQCVFHHPLTVHGSFENTTERPRRAAVINVIRDGVCSASAEPLLEQIPVVPVGTPLDGQFFPLLWPVGSVTRRGGRCL